MKHKLRRFMAGFLAVLTMAAILFTNGTSAYAASPSAMGLLQHSPWYGLS